MRRKRRNVKMVTAKDNDPNLVRINSTLEACLSDSEKPVEIANCINRFGDSRDVKIYSSPKCDPCVVLEREIEKIDGDSVDLINIDEEKEEEIKLEKKIGSVVVPSIFVEGRLAKVGTRSSMDL